MEKKNYTYAVRSQMFEGVLLIFFHSYSFQQHSNTNEFHIFQTFEIENVGQIHVVEKRDLTPFDRKYQSL